MMDQCESVATGSIPGTPRTCLTSVDYHGALPTHFRLVFGEQASPIFQTSVQ